MNETKLIAAFKSAMSLKSASSADAAINKAITDLMKASPLEEANVLDEVLGWAQLHAAGHADWLIQNLKGDVELLETAAVRGRKTQHGVFFAIPVLMPERVVRRQLESTIGLEMLRISLHEGGIIHEAAQVRLCGELVHIDELYGRSFAEMKAVGVALMEQAITTASGPLQIPVKFWNEPAPKIADWTERFDVELYFVLGTLVSPREVLPDLFRMESDESELPDTVAEQLDALVPGATGRMSNGIPWEEAAILSLNHSVFSCHEPLRVDYPISLYGGIECGLEMARCTKLQTDFEIGMVANGLDAEELFAEIYTSRDEDGVHVAGYSVRVARRASPSEEIFGVDWPLLSHENESDCLDCLRLALESMELALPAGLVEREDEAGLYALH